jgi:hypothetical protein
MIQHIRLIDFEKVIKIGVIQIDFYLIKHFCTAPSFSRTLNPLVAALSLCIEETLDVEVLFLFASQLRQLYTIY